MVEGSPPPSCRVSGPGTTSCGAASESCCTSLEVPGGTYYRTYTNNGGGASGLADPATVSRFRLDKYDVTVGRFRRFVSAWSDGAGFTPPVGSGKHTHLNDGQGLADSARAGAHEPGWLAADTVNLAPNDADLACDPGFATWTSVAGDRETLPINCVTWWEAYAFCIWDGGFLPSEAEWEYAAAGGSQQREYPWGTTPPGTANEYAIHDCSYPSGTTNCADVSNIAPVGTATAGAGLLGQLDLAGNVWQWNLDWSAPYTACTDCAYLTETSIRVLRGGNFSVYGGISYLLPPTRNDDTPADRSYDVGFRCARTP
jgi:formylglycine-generating enzyme required for sulfatase activity